MSMHVTIGEQNKTIRRLIGYTSHEDRNRCGNCVYFYQLGGQVYCDRYKVPVNRWGICESYQRKPVPCECPF